MFLTVSLQNQKIALGWAWMGIKWLELCNLCFFLFKHLLSVPLPLKLTVKWFRAKSICDG